MDDEDGPSLQNPGPEECDHDSDADDEGMGDVTMHMEEEVRKVTNDMCRLSFAPGCDPVWYQASLKCGMTAWQKMAIIYVSICMAL